MITKSYKNIHNFNRITPLEILFHVAVGDTPLGAIDQLNRQPTLFRQFARSNSSNTSELSSGLQRPTHLKNILYILEIQKMKESS